MFERYPFTIDLLQGLFVERLVRSLMVVEALTMIDFPCLSNSESFF
jgi:hypothetical protein